MATQNQIEANGRNAQHSTGPRTPEGKAASSMNALKSGIDAESNVIPGEDAAVLAALTERLYQGCQPQTDIECLLVDDIVRDTWLLTRLARIDTQLMIHTIEDTNYPSPNGPAGKAFNNTANTQSRLQRRINDTRRLRLQSIKELQLLQAARPQPPAPQTTPQPALQLTETESPPSPIGFVPQTHIPEPTPAPEPALPPAPGPRPQASGPRHPAPGIRPPAPRPPNWTSTHPKPQHKGCSAPNEYVRTHFHLA
jgi:hypothetical protein